MNNQWVTSANNYKFEEKLNTYYENYDLSSVRESQRRNVAMLLDNQSLLNTHFEQHHGIEEYFMQLTKNVFSQLRVCNWVNLYIMLGPEVDEPIKLKAKSRKLATPPPHNPENYPNLASDIIEEIELEVINDLMMIASHSIAESSRKNLEQALLLHNSPNSIFIIPERFQKVISVRVNEELNIDYVNFSKRQILIIKDPKAYDNFYAPYIPFFLPEPFSLEGFSPRSSILTRYGKNINPRSKNVTQIKYEGKL